MGIPNSCLSCPFESSCNSAMGLSGCHFYYEDNKNSFISRLKENFGKLFK